MTHMYTAIEITFPHDLDLESLEILEELFSNALEQATSEPTTWSWADYTWCLNSSRSSFTATINSEAEVGGTASAIERWSRRFPLATFELIEEWTGEGGPTIERNVWVAGQRAIQANSELVDQLAVARFLVAAGQAESFRTGSLNDEEISYAWEAIDAAASALGVTIPGRQEQP